MYDCKITFQNDYEVKLLIDRKRSTTRCTGTKWRSKAKACQLKITVVVHRGFQPNSSPLACCPRRRLFRTQNYAKRVAGRGGKTAVLSKTLARRSAPPATGARVFELTVDARHKRLLHLHITFRRGTRGSSGCTLQNTPNTE